MGTGDTGGKRPSVRMVFGGRYHIRDRRYQSGDQIVLDLLGDEPERFWGWMQAACAVPPASGLTEAGNAMGCIVDDLRAHGVSPNDHRHWMNLLCRMVAVQYQVTNSESVPAVWDHEAKAIEKLILTSIKRLIKLLHVTSAARVMSPIGLSVNDAIAPLALAAECARNLGARADEVIVNNAIRGADLPVVWHPLSFGVVSSTHNESDVLLALAFAMAGEGLALDPVTIEVGCCGDAVVAIRGIAL